MADTVRFSTGVNGAKGKRNAPALVNMAWQPSFMRDGGVPTLEMQVLSPISDPLEMAFNIAEASERLMHDSFYVREARLAYGRNPDPYVITRALAAYQRTIISGASDYDRYQKNRPSHVLSTSAEKGYRLFFSHKTDCSKCHSGFNFTDYSIRGNGLYRNYRDTGRARITFRKADVGKFRVPGLRNVAVTAPYMHDGSLQTLEEVVEHYNRGGQNHVNQDSLIRPLGLNAREKTDLVAFLQTLTDTAFLQKSMNYE